MEVLDPYPFSYEIWEAYVPKGFKPTSLAKFDGHSDPYEHVASINTQMVIMGTHDSLKRKFLFGTFRDASL